MEDSKVMKVDGSARVRFGFAMMAVAALLSCAISVYAADEALLLDDFTKDGPLDPEKWEIITNKPPTCREGCLINGRNMNWSSKRLFSEPVSIEFSGVYLKALPVSGTSVLGLGRTGWGPEGVGWVFSGYRKGRAKSLRPIRTMARRHYRTEDPDAIVDLNELPDVTKKENAVKLKIDWWPGKIVRYCFNDRLVAQYTDLVPSAALPVVVRDETVQFRIDGIKVTRITTPMNEVMEQFARVEEARRQARRREQAAANARLEAIRARMAVSASPPRYALLLHLEGEEAVKDSSVYGFKLTPERVSYERGRFGRAARFDGEQSRMVLEKPMIELPDYQYLSLCFPTQTVECWIRPEQTGAAETVLGAIRWVNPHNPKHKLHGWQLLREKDGRTGFQWGGTRITSASQAPVGEWTHVAVVVDGVAGHATLFLDGKAEGTTPAGMIKCGGKFFVGAGDAGFFKGLIDEVVIHLSALPAEEIATRAKAGSALSDPKIESRYYALPANDHTFIFLNHGDLPGNWLLLRLPEYTTSLPGQGVRTGRNVRWVWENGGWTYTWSASEAEKKKSLLDFTGRIIPGKDRVLYQLTSSNPGAGRWLKPQMRYACMKCTGAPQFQDFEATRTFVRQGDRFITVLEAAGGELHVDKTGFSRTGGGAGRLFAKQSADGKWVLGIITDNARGTIGNFGRHTFCMHSNPVWGLLEPGESKTIHGCVYLLRGGLDDLWDRCEKGFSP